MTAELIHRGPDDEGYYCDPNGRCALGFRRLAIIDLQTGQQPACDADEMVHVVFNGEIYNFRELRDELERLGHRFRTRGDAEVIVYAYREWGVECLPRLHGMFAIAIWDRRTSELLLARDRFGKKPLYHTQVRGQLHFGSELKALVALARVERWLDPQAIHRYLLFQYIPAPHSIYRGVHKLPPGTYLRMRSGNVEPPTPYWRLPHQRSDSPPAFKGTYQDARARLDELLAAAVRKRLIADVPLGAFLSGGRRLIDRRRADAPAGRVADPHVFDRLRRPALRRDHPCPPRRRAVSRGAPRADGHPQRRAGSRYARLAL